jgi:4-amino-4-deoxy-L-arabinose transferase-like glycosyltransferase
MRDSLLQQPSPAIVAQSAVRRLPRAALLLFCVAYVLAGFIGRDPWKSADVAAFGYMVELVAGTSSWWNPTLMGQPESALLPFWLGAWSLQLAPSWIAPAFAARLPFLALLTLTFAATWYAVYYLARSPRAQPVAFAFGGEARPSDYARALADGGLLGLIACLGLAQLSHEITPAQTQLCCAALTFFGLSTLPWRPRLALCAVAAGLFGLSLSGAPALSLLFGLGGAAIGLLEDDTEPAPAATRRRQRMHALAVLLIALAAAALAWALDQWRWRIALPPPQWSTWRSLGRLLLWFTWPIWPMALWTLWRWRRQLSGGRPDRHFAIPLWMLAVTLGCTLLTPSSDRSLLLGLPALAALAAFALPTFGRSVGALIDWFTLLFFTSSAITIWVIWISLQTGVPAKPAANVAKLAQGFVPSFSLAAFVLALIATGIWAWLVRWRVGRHPSVIWKSLVLPAGGTALCWVLLMTLGLPTLNYARSYAPLVRNVQARMDAPGCVEAYGFTRAQVAAFRYHGQMQLQPAAATPACPWLLVHSDAVSTFRTTVPPGQWTLVASVRRPADKDEDVLLFRR